LSVQAERNSSPLDHCFVVDPSFVIPRNHHHHHFVCPIIQHYAHLHQYNLEEQNSKVRQNTNGCPGMFNKTVIGYIFYHTSKILQTNKKLEKKSVFSMLFLKTYATKGENIFKGYKNR